MSQPERDQDHDPLAASRRAETANAAHRPVEVDGDQVTRPAGPASRTVHHLLAHLRGRGLDCVPEPLALSPTTETLRWLPGDSGGDAWRHQHSDAGLASAARLLRRVHDAARGWTPPADAVWGAPPVPVDPDGTDELVWCHGDPGPWNMVWRDGEAVALIDWDLLHPGPRLDDVAYALQWFAPLRSDELAREWHHFPEVPDRRHRVEVFVQAYEQDRPVLAPFDLVDAVTARMRAVSDLVAALAEDGVEPQRTWVAEGLLQARAVEIAWVRDHRALLG